MSNSFEPTTNKAGANGGFFGSITAGLGDALGSVARDILPVWTAKQLNVQNHDQLSQPTFNAANAGARIDGYGNTTVNGTPVRASTTGLLFDNINVSGAAILGLAVAIVAGIALAKL